MGAGAKSPSALAPFAHNWVGGDIHGLSAYAGTLYGYVPRLSDVATALDKKVSQIVGDAGWKGSAAAAFSKAWQHDATGATALAVWGVSTLLGFGAVLGSRLASQPAPKAVIA